MSEGTVRELWRYPIKSLGGELLPAATIGDKGILGDRGWVMRDETTGRFGTAKRIPALFTMSARYIWEPKNAEDSPPVEITLPDGWKVRSDNPKSAERVSEALEREITLWPRQPADNLDFYRRPPVDPAVDLKADAYKILGLEADEEIPPVLAPTPVENRPFMAPPGTYFDAFPILLVTTASLATVEAALGASSAAVKRFRPNILIDSPAGATGFPEHDWAGRKVRVGGAVLEAVGPCIRCAMVTLPQPGLDRDTPLMRYLHRETGQNLGLYCRVLELGVVNTGDLVELV